jgi:hypothetical protein
MIQRPEAETFPMVRLLILSGLFLFLSWPTGKIPARQERKKIFVGVDGVSLEDFTYAREKLGLFRTLKFSKTHVSTFPSISDYSWNVMVHAREVMGKRGRIRTYEAAHFDRERNELVSDPREYFRRLGEDHHYFTGAFEHWLNPYVESLLYIPTEELPKLELKQLLAAVKEDKRMLVTVMVASSDALAHTRADGNKFLLELDKFVTDLSQHYRTEGEDVEIILASDHGQASRFYPGQKSEPLIGVNLQGVLERSGLQSVTKLISHNDVVLPVMALANYGTAFFQEKEKRRDFIDEIKKEKWFSLALYRESASSSLVKLSLFDKDGKAELTIRKDQDYSYFYHPQSSNPLGLSEESHERWLSDGEARELTGKTVFPDSLYRIAFSAFEEEADFPDLLFTLRDEYFVAGEFDSFTTMYQTHGSLGRRASSGILASTHPLKLSQKELRTGEILEAAGIRPEEMFQSTSRGLYPLTDGLIATGSEDWSHRRIFALMNRAVQDSRYVFEEKSLDVILGVVKPLLNKNAPELPSVNWKETMSLADVAHLIDLMIRNGNVDTIKNDPRFLQIKSKLASVGQDQKRLPSAEHHEWHSPELVRKSDAAKKIAMKSYSSMFLLEKALSLPEMPFIQDPRSTNIDKTDPKKVFSDIFTERTLLSEIFPAKFPTHWRAILPPESITLVYIPGIYNSLFDDEIFRNGLDHLKNEWGMRVISPRVFSTCSSGVNGKLILDEMKKDLASQKNLGHPEPSYFVLGYSKGGVDALHGFAADPGFVSRHVTGLLTMASPIKGSSILNKTDLPLEIMELLGSEKAPAICRTEEKASRSITPAGAQSFLRKNAPKLVGLTRYFSLSFVSELKDSHLFMRATKNIGRFGEPNDGVVALSASTFPEEFGAVNLGIVKADHLAGIVASHFPHEAFMESVLFTMGHLNAFDHSQNREINERITYSGKKTDPERHRKFLSEKIGPLTQKIFSADSSLPEMARLLRHSLAGSPYELKPFSLVRKKNKIHVSFREGRWPSVAGGSSVPVKDVEELHSLFLTSLQASGRNLLRASRINVPESKRTPTSPPANELGYDEDFRIKVRELDKFISGKRVVPVSHLTHPQGFSFIYDHASSSEFRNEYQFSFEDSAPPDADDNQQSGWETVVMGDKVWGKLASANSSIRLSTYSWRFKPSDFPDLGIEIQVNDDVDGADVLYGGSGKDDSAFQLWFTFRILDDNKNREYLHHDEKMMTIGYYFGDEIPGKDLQLNGIYKNYYSEKDFVIAKLPAAKQKLIGLGKEMLGKVLSSQHNLLEDIRASYPEIDASKAEIVAITIQHDSNDTKGKSEAFFHSIELRPQLNRTVKAD